MTLYHHITNFALGSGKLTINYRLCNLRSSVDDKTETNFLGDIFFLLVLQHSGVWGIVSSNRKVTMALVNLSSGCSMQQHSVCSQISVLAVLTLLWQCVLSKMDYITGQSQLCTVVFTDRPSLNLPNSTIDRLPPPPDTDLATDFAKKWTKLAETLRSLDLGFNLSHRKKNCQTLEPVRWLVKRS